MELLLLITLLSTPDKPEPPQLRPEERIELLLPTLGLGRRVIEIRATKKKRRIEECE